jgi:hypothetical protein
MPTNLPPDYFDAEKRFREAEGSAEKKACLEEMISIVPKHKGTDKLRADLRRQLSRLKADADEHKKHSSHASSFHIEREGAGQVALVGLTNVGKSALVAALTHARPEVSPAIHSTWKPTPGMMRYENIQIQLIDTPPLDPEFTDPGVFDLVRRADLILVLVDIQADPFDQYETSLRLLREHRIVPKIPTEETPIEERLTCLPVILVANKCDDAGYEDDFAVLCELFEGECPLIPISAVTGRSFDRLMIRIYEALEIIRVYAKPPGKEPDLATPFTLKKGSTVADLARKVHRDFYEHLKSARVWGSTSFAGQLVQRDYPLQEGDLVELRD